MELITVSWLIAVVFFCFTNIGGCERCRVSDVKDERCRIYDVYTILCDLNVYLSSEKEKCIQ